MSNKEEALATIKTLVETHQLTEQDIMYALKTNDKAKQQASILSKLFAFLGGIFLFAGIGIYISMFWPEMNSAARILITLGTGLVVFIIAVIFNTQPGYRHFSKSTTPLFLIAAFLQTAGLFVTLDELFEPINNPQLTFIAIFAAMFTQQLITFYNTQRTVLLFSALIFGSVGLSTALDYIGLQSELNLALTGLALLGSCYYIDKTPHQTISGFWYFIGGAVFLNGFFNLLEDTPVELAFLAISCLLVYMSTALRSRALLFISTCGILFYIGYFTTEHFVDSVGWPLALMIFGLMLIGVSTSSYRLSQKYMR